MGKVNITLLLEVAQDILQRVPRVKPSPTDINSLQVLIELAKKEEWLASDIEQLDFISKRIDISNKLFVAFDKNGRKTSSEVIEDTAILELLVYVLFRGVVHEHSYGTSIALLLKRINVLYKATYLVDVGWFSDGAELRIFFDELWDKKIAELPIKETSFNLMDCSTKTHSKKTLREIPLTVLFYEGPIARAYLETMCSLGLKPQKIIHLVSSKNLVSGKPVARWLPRGMRKIYATNLQKNQIHFWGNHLCKKNTQLIGNIKAVIERDLSFSVNTTERAHQLLDLTNYSDVVETVLIEGLSDTALHKYLTAQQKSAVLFTGGGIVPKKLLEISTLKFLHIHPGFLPDIRGADCALWSHLLTGHFSASCFYMAAGIDVGDIIQASWLPQIDLSACSVDDLNLQMKYRLVYGFVDPWVRASVLRQVLLSHEDYFSIKTQLQEEHEGLTYHFMSKELKELSFSKMFNPTNMV